MHFKPKTLLISLAAAVTLYALLGFLILPAVALSLINKQFEERATLPAHLDDIKFNPFTLELTLTGLHIGELDEPEVAFERLYANVQIDSLWSRALHLRDVELAQAFTRVHFAKDGTLNLTKLFILPQPAEQTGEETDSAPFPVRIDRLALIANSLQFQDLRTSDPVEFGYDAVDMELTNLSTLPDDHTLMQLSASGPYGARIDWEGQLSLSPLASSGTLKIDEARLGTFWPYINEQLPLTLNKGTLSVSSRYQLSLVESTELILTDLHLQLNNLDLAAQNSPLLRLQGLEISDTSMDLARREVRVGTLQSQGLHAWAVRQKNGQIDWLELLQPSASAAAQPPDAADIIIVDTSTAVEPASESEQPWRVLLSQAQLHDYRLHLTDQQPNTPVALNIGPLNVDLSGFDSQSESPFQLSLDTAVNESGKLSASGTLGINPIAADLQVATQDIDLTLAQAYLEPLVHLELRSGQLSSTLHVQLQQLEPLQLEITGQAGVQQLHIVDGPARRDLLKWQSLTLDDIRYQGNGLRINKVHLQQPYVRFIINRDMSTNFSDLVVSQPDSTTTGASEPFAIQIGGVGISDGSANFADFSLTPNFATGIEQLNGSIGTLDNQSNKAAAVDLEGKVDRYAPVTIKGSLMPFDPLNSLDIATRFRNIELTTLTPYSGKFAGYRIRKGRLNLDLHYQIDQGQLKAHNKLLLEDLQLGERVDSPDAVDLPLKLALALLKDTRGNIDIELPVAGDLNNPEFSVMPIVWQTLRNLMLRATQAPFKFIAGLAGADDMDLSQISFQSGSIELDAHALETLGTLVSALQERPQLILEVEGISAASADGPALAVQRLEREMRQLAANNMRRPPQDLAEIELDDRDESKLIRELHAQHQLPEPEEWKQLSRAERDQAKRQALIENWGESPLPLRRLAQQRAAVIKDWFVDEGGLSAERIHLLEVSEGRLNAQGRIASQLQLGIQ